MTQILALAIDLYLRKLPQTYAKYLLVMVSGCMSPEERRRDMRSDGPVRGVRRGRLREARTVGERTEGGAAAGLRARISMTGTSGVS
jgi:hypothetical protein